MNRLAKQLIYGGIYLVIFGLVFWGVYRFFVPVPTCTDGIQNQSEDGIDCGVACGKFCSPAIVPLTVSPAQLIHYPNDSWDALVRLDNPNATYGALRVPYTLVVTGAGGQQIAMRRGMTYVNPLEPQYLAFSLPGASDIPAVAALQFVPTEVQWAELDAQDGHVVQFGVRQERFGAAPSGFRYQADVVNDSPYDFDLVDVTVRFSDDSGAVVGVGATVIKTLLAGETRGFSIAWPFAIPGVVSVQTSVTTNLFNNANYLRARGSGEPFQGF